jgi:hypothetical protein
MPTDTQIIIIDEETGNPISNEKICVSFDSGGFSSEDWTDRDGVAIVNHTSTGEAWLYVGPNCVGKIMTPGRVAIKLYWTSVGWKNRKYNG